MSIKDIVLAKEKLGCNATEIHNFLKAELGDKAIGYSTVTKYLREQKFSEESSSSNNETIPYWDYKKDEKIQEALHENPFLSVRGISAQTGIASSSVHWILTSRMKYKNKKLQKVPHTLTCDMKRKRVEGSKLLLKYLAMMKKNNFRYFSTGDESFFKYDLKRKTIWLPEDENPPETSTDKYESTKIMVSIFWSPRGIQLLKYLPEGQSFDGQYFIEEILQEITQDQYAQDAKRNKKLFYLHFDNAPSHRKTGVSEFCKKNKLFILPHPPYSPDLAPSDFFLFGYIKEKCEGVEFTSPDELIEFIENIFSQISSDVFERVFLNWEERLKRYIQVNGDYF